MGKNHYYLKHLAPDVRLYTFVESTKKLYKYTPKGVEIASFTRTMMNLNNRARDIWIILILMYCLQIVQKKQ